MSRSDIDHAGALAEIFLGPALAEGVGEFAALVVGGDHKVDVTEIVGNVLARDGAAKVARIVDG